MDRSIQRKQELFDFRDKGQIMTDSPKDFLLTIPNCLQTYISLCRIIFTGLFLECNDTVRSIIEDGADFLFPG